MVCHRFLRSLNRFAALLVIVGAFSPALESQQKAPAHPTIVFMTDFGVLDDSVAICKGVMLGVASDIRIVDLTHEVRPYSIEDGARFLYGATPYYPADTVFVVVIDPGVGSARKAIVAKSKRGQYFVLPDNGLLTMVEDRDGIEGVREITNRQWMIGSALSSTFHGRDIFSPVGAHLAAGEDWMQVGPELKQLVRVNIVPPRVDNTGIMAQAIALDGPYGNVVTDIPADEFRGLGYSLGDEVPVTVGKKQVPLPFVRTFSDVAVGKPLLYIDSRGRIGLAVNQGNFSAVYHVEPPQPVKIPRKLMKSDKGCGASNVSL